MSILAIQNGATSQLRIKIVLPIRHLQEVKRTRLDIDGKDISAIGGLPAEGKFPAVEVAGEAEVGIDQLFLLEVVTDVADPDIPLGVELDVARKTDVVGRDDQRIAVAPIAVWDQSAGEADAVVHAEIVEPAQNIVVDLVGLGRTAGICLCFVFFGEKGAQLFDLEACIERKIEADGAHQFTLFLQREAVDPRALGIVDVGVEGGAPSELRNTFEQAKQTAGADRAPLQRVAGNAIVPGEYQVVEQTAFEDGVPFGVMGFKFDHVADAVREVEIPLSHAGFAKRGFVKNTVGNGVPVFWPIIRPKFPEILFPVEAGAKTHGGRVGHFVSEASEPALLKLLGQEADGRGRYPGVIIAETVETPLAVGGVHPVAGLGFVKLDAVYVPVGAFDGVIDQDVAVQQLAFGDVGVPVFFVADVGGQGNIFK